MKPSVVIKAIVLIATITVVPINAVAQSIRPFIKPEQHRIHYRDPACLPSVYVADTPAPPTVTNPNTNLPERDLSLDEAIRIALSNSEVVRSLAGTLATSSGRTIYDAAITNTTIDDARSTFDPQLSVENSWNQTEPPGAIIDPLDPSRAVFRGTKTQDHRFGIDLSQTNMSGGTARYKFNNTWSKFHPGIFPLNPQNRYSNEVSYTQPLLNGAGVEANRVPIVLARINTERSYFQFTDSVQELVRGVVAAYWSLVFARTDEWARRIQAEQTGEAVDIGNARLRKGLADISELTQARSALARFEANLIAAEANVLQREAALQNILGNPPTEQFKIIPTTPPTMEQVDFDWNEVKQIAGVRRPDLIELKLVLEADTQRLIAARNTAKPTLNAVGTYRWNGLEGEMPGGSRIATTGNQFTDWSMGVNFSVPLFLRQGRASVRSAELVIARDRANLQQGYHNVNHRLALTFRNLDQFYSQYLAFKKLREAARVNLEQQAAARESGRIIFLNVLEAITEWGNAVSQEASSLAQYNTELANLERETGTILETHSVFMFEDRFCSIGPICYLKKDEKPFPRDIRPGPNANRYPDSGEPAENTFDLDNYPRRDDLPRKKSKREELDLPPLPEPQSSDDSENGSSQESSAPKKSFFRRLSIGKFFSRK